MICKYCGAGKVFVTKHAIKNRNCTLPLPVVTCNVCTIIGDATGYKSDKNGNLMEITSVK